MYEKDGRRYFIVDGHTHFWDARPENRNRYGEGFIANFYDYHRNLSPEEYVWAKDTYDSYSEQDMVHDLFEIGYVDAGPRAPAFVTSEGVPVTAADVPRFRRLARLISLSLEGNAGLCRGLLKTRYDLPEEIAA